MIQTLSYGPIPMTMNRTALVAVIAGFPILAQAQLLEDVQVLSPPCAPFQTEVTVFFPFGHEQACPTLTGYTVEPGAVTAFISLYYDVSGAWPQVGCWNTSLIVSDAMPDIVYANLRTFSIMEGDTSVVVADTVINYCLTTGLAESVPSRPEVWVQEEELRWDPTRETGDGSIRLIAGNGQCMATCDYGRGTCALRNLPPGSYTAIRNDRTLLRFVRP